MELDDLISQVEDAAITEEPLDRLAAAMGVKADMDDLTDSLIGVFVDRARQAGCSWSEIGSAMGVTKQAAQQRHTGERRGRGRDRSDRGDRGNRPFRMQRFTQRARTAVRQASHAAEDLGQDHIDTEHLLLGILDVPQSIGAKALTALGVTRAGVLDAVERGPATSGREGRRRRIPFSAHAKQVLELALSEALKLGHSYVGTEHIVLALLRVPDGLAAKAMTEKGIDAAGLLAEVTKLLAA